MVAWKRGLFPRVLARYGPRCAKCGYDENPLALVLDHIEDDGAAHREEILKQAGYKDTRRGGGSWQTYADLIRHGFPPTVQVLCANCNTIKQRLKYQEEQA